MDGRFVAAVFVRPKLISRPMLSSCAMSSLITDLDDEALRFTADIPGPTLLELEGGPRSSRSVRDVEGGGLCDRVRLLDLGRVGGGFRLVERARRVLDVEGGRLPDLAGGRWCEELGCSIPVTDLVRLVDRSRV